MDKLAFCHSQTTLVPQRMEGLVDLGVKFGPATWNRVHATVDTISDCATRRPPLLYWDGNKQRKTFTCEVTQNKSNN